MKNLNPSIFSKISKTHPLPFIRDAEWERGREGGAGEGGSNYVTLLLHLKLDLNQQFISIFFRIITYCLSPQSCSKSYLVSWLKANEEIKMLNHQKELQLYPLAHFKRVVAWWYDINLSVSLPNSITPNTIHSTRLLTKAFLFFLYICYRILKYAAIEV